MARLGQQFDGSIGGGKLESERAPVKAVALTVPALDAGDLFANFVEWDDDADEIAYRDL
jgi:hypothetical protein